VQQPDAIIHQPVRLRIMAALRVLPAGERIEFVRLKAIVRATEGNLGAHIGTLENAGYVRVDKDFNGKKPRTRVSLSEPGRRAFADYITYLRGILDGEGAAPHTGGSADVD
jgi:DNA-binding MarR family transcriptional regulator